MNSYTPNNQFLFSFLKTLFHLFISRDACAIVHACRSETSMYELGFFLSLGMELGMVLGMELK